VKIIEPGVVFDLIAQALGQASDYFGWDKGRIIRTALRNLPAPEIINDFPAGAFFALIQLGPIHPDPVGNEIYENRYNFIIVICRKGYEGATSKLREEMVERSMGAFLK
jgi:hypothetical protein